MKKLIKITTLLVFVSVFLYGEERIELMPSLEKIIKPPEHIPYFIYDTTKMKVKEAKKMGIKEIETKPDTAIVEIIYPKVLFVAPDTSMPYRYDVEKVIFLNIKGKIKKVVELPKRVIETVKGKEKVGIGQILKSENNKFIAVFFPVGSSGKKYKIKIFENNGNLKWEREYYEEWWGYRSLYGVSPNGKYWIRYDPESRWLDVCYEDGKILNISNYARYKVKYISGGKYAVFYFYTGRGSANYRGHLVMIDENGRKLWHKEDIVYGESAMFSTIHSANENEIVIEVKTTDFKKILKRLYFDFNGNLVKEVKGED